MSAGKVDEAEIIICAISELRERGWLPSAVLEQHRVSAGVSQYAWYKACMRLGLRHQRDGTRWITVYPHGDLGDPPAAIAATVAVTPPGAIRTGWPEIMLAVATLAAAVVVIWVYAA